MNKMFDSYEIFSVTIYVLFLLEIVFGWGFSGI